MEQSYLALPGEFYAYSLLILLVVVISVLVVWPAVWSTDAARREAAFRVLDRILTFLRPPRAGSADPRTTARGCLSKARPRGRAPKSLRGGSHRRRRLSGTGSNRIRRDARSPVSAAGKRGTMTLGEPEQLRSSSASHALHAALRILFQQELCLVVIELPSRYCNQLVAISTGKSASARAIHHSPGATGPRRSLGAQQSRQPFPATQCYCANGCVVTIRSPSVRINAIPWFRRTFP